MSIKSKIRKGLIKLTGYWIYKQDKIPVGCDLPTDLQKKLKLTVNTIFDVGANIGQSTKKFIINYKGATIYAFEPFEPAYSTFNLTYSSDKIHCYKLALGDTIGEKEIPTYEGDLSVLNSLSKSAINSATGIKQKVEVTTGDVFCNQHHITQIDLLKIDTEGYEIEVLKGFEQGLKNGMIKTILCEVGFSKRNKRNTHISDLMHYFDAMNYHFYGIYETENQQIKEHHNFGNLLFVHHSTLPQL